MTSQAVKLPPYLIDVCKGQLASVSPIREKNKDAIMLRVDPTTSSSESVVTKTVSWQIRSCGRLFSGR